MVRVEKGWIDNFMLVFQYPMTVFVAPLEDTLAAQDPGVLRDSQHPRPGALPPARAAAHPGAPGVLPERVPLPLGAWRAACAASADRRATHLPW